MTYGKWVWGVMAWGILIVALPVLAQSTPITASNAATVHVVGTVGYGGANDAATSPDGQFIAVATGTGVWLFDRLFVSGVQVHQGRANAVAWRGNGEELAAALADGTVRVWESATWAERLRIEAHVPAGAVAVAWSPDGTQITSGGADGGVDVWESRNGSSFFSLSGHDSPVVSLSVSSFGTVVSATQSELWVWNTMTGLADPIDGYYGLAVWSPDARYLLTRTRDALVVLDGETRTALNAFSLEGDSPIRVKWSPQGTTFAVVGQDGVSVRLLDAWTGVQRGVLGDVPASALAWSNDGMRLTVWANDGVMSVWSTFDETLQHSTTGWHGDIQAISWSVDGGQLELRGDESVFVWDVATNALLTTEATFTPAPPSSGLPSAQIATSPQGNILTILNANGAISGQYPTPFSPSVTPLGVAEIAVTSAGDVLAGAVEFTNMIGDVVYLVALWDSATGTQLAQLSTHGAPISTLSFSPDGRLLATLDVNGVVYLWGVD
jgi:WD40 repeat protein